MTTVIQNTWGTFKNVFWKQMQYVYNVFILKGNYLFIYLF